MGSFGPIHWIMVAAVTLLVFGGRIKLSAVMGDAAQGLRAFRDGLKDEASAAPAQPTRLLPITESPSDSEVR